VTETTGPRGTFAKNLAQMKSAKEKEVNRVVHMAANKHVESQVHLSDPETEVGVWSIADKDKFVSQLEREIHGITSNEQIQFNKELNIHLIQYEAW